MENSRQKSPLSAELRFIHEKAHCFRSLVLIYYFLEIALENLKKISIVFKRNNAMIIIFKVHKIKKCEQKKKN